MHPVTKPVQAATGTKSGIDLFDAIERFGIAETLHFVSGYCAMRSESESDGTIRKWWDFQSRLVGGFSARVRSYEHK